MKCLLRIWVVVCIGFLGISARADYGWIPEYQKLNLRAGSDFYSTSQNYNATGTLEPLTGSNGNLHEFRLWLEGEYGIAEDWALRLKFGYLDSSLDNVTTGQTLAAGSGLTDVTVGAKWNFKSDYPMLTFEVYTIVPTSSNTVPANTQLVLGDGNFNMGFVLHGGARAGAFVFSLSPGVLARFGGYSSAAIGEAAVQLNLPRVYLRGFARGTYPFENVQPFDVDPTKHTALGAGGSYEKLNGSPEGFSGGAMIGVVPIHSFRVEAYLEHSFYGKQYPYYTSFGFDLMYTFDFFTPKKKTRAHEVPFEGEQPSGFPD